MPTTAVAMAPIACGRGQREDSVGLGVATTRGSPTSGPKPCAQGVIPMTIMTWWRVSANTTSRAMPRLSQPSSVPKPEMKPRVDPQHVLDCSLESHLGWNGPSGLQAEETTDGGSDRNIAACRRSDLDSLPGGAPSGVLPNLSCPGGGKTEDSAAGSAWDLRGTKQGSTVRGTDDGAPPPPPPPTA